MMPTDQLGDWYTCPQSVQSSYTELSVLKTAPPVTASTLCASSPPQMSSSHEGWCGLSHVSSTTQPDESNRQLRDGKLGKAGLRLGKFLELHLCK